MKKQHEDQKRKGRRKRVWDGVFSDLDRYYAGHDKRQMHFEFYLGGDPLTSPLDPGKKPPSPGSGERKHRSHSAKRVV